MTFELRSSSQVLPESRRKPRKRAPILWRRILASLAFVATLVIVGVSASRLVRGAPSGVAKVFRGQELPSIPLQDIGGVSVDLRDVAPGRPRVIVFYSPSCGACQREVPALEPFPDEVELIMVREGTDDGLDDLLSSVIRRYRLVDRDNAFSRTIPMASLPTVFFVDPAGVLTDASIGILSRERMQSTLARFAAGRK